MGRFKPIVATEYNINIYSCLVYDIKREAYPVSPRLFKVEMCSLKPYGLIMFSRLPLDRGDVISASKCQAFKLD